MAPGDLPPSSTPPGHFSRTVKESTYDTLQESDEVQATLDLLAWSSPTQNPVTLDRFGFWWQHSEALDGDAAPVVAAPKPKGKSSKIHSPDLDYLERWLWRGCVEERTYRYVPNNGKYRAAKAALQKYSGGVKQRRTGKKVLSSEQKQRQKEIQAELRSEFEALEKQGQWAKSSPSNEKVTKKVTVPAAAPSKQTAVPPSDYKKPKRTVSPVALPPIAVPLVSNTSSSHLVKVMSSKTPDVRSSLERTKLKVRSMSEPPPGVSDVGPFPSTDFRRDISSISESNSGGPTTHGHRHVGRPTDIPRSSTNRHRAWGSSGVTPSETGTDEGQIVDVVLSSQGITDRDGKKKPKVGNSQSVSSVLVSQLRYMSASGEVTVVPQFGHESVNNSFYGMLNRENPHRGSPEHDDSDVRSNKENLHSVMTTSTSPVLQRPKDIPGAKLKNIHLRTNIVENAAGKSRVTDGFRAAPIGRHKSRDQGKAVASAAELFPRITGRKCDMSATTHRIV